MPTIKPTDGLRKETVMGNAKVKYTTNEAIRNILISGNESAVWMAVVLSKSTEFSNCSSRRIKALSRLVGAGVSVGLTASWQPIIANSVISWDHYDLLVVDNIAKLTVAQLLGLVEKVSVGRAEPVLGGIARLLAEEIANG